MALRQRILDRGKRMVMNPALMRVISDDRVMRAAEGVLDARTRMRAAWKILRSGHELPHADPALDDTIGEQEEGAPPISRSRGNGTTNGTTNGAKKKKNGAHAVSGAYRGAGVDPTLNDPDDEAAGRGNRAQVNDHLKERTSLAALGGKDVFDKCQQFQAVDNARKVGIYPFFRPLDFNDGPEAQIDGKRVVMFGSNNYLGLTTHPKVRQAAKDAIDRFGTSMTGSRLVNGSMKLHNELEDKLCAWFGKEAALVFTTGYQVNVATLQALLSNKRSVAMIDRNVHASLYDGSRLALAAGARLVRYKHNDAESLDRALERLDDAEGALVITDGVFSAEGEIANLDKIVPVVKKHGARLFVDDAHALGVIGPGGRGTPYHFGLADQVDIIGGTFSKSLASTGGWLVGDRKVLDYIKHFAPSFMFAASAAPPAMAAAIAAFEVMNEEPERQVQLRENFTYMRTELRRLGFDLGKTETAVIPIYIRQDLRTLMVWRELLEEYGVYTNPFISPGVPPKHSMLRTSYMATHTRAHLDRGLEALEKVGKKYGVI